MKYSFIIPTFNRISSLKKCILSIENQIFNPFDYEIIVVNDGGEIPALNNIKLIHQSNQGPASARNSGAKIAQGAYLIFVDDDCELDKNWLSKIDFKVQENVLLTGYTKNIIPSLWAEASQTLLNYLYDAWKNCEWSFFASNNMVISKIDFDKVGGFNENFPLAAAEDREFCLRAIRMKIQLVQVNEALVYHSHHLNFTSYCKQHTNYGKGAYYFNDVLKQYQLKIPVQPFVFYLKMILFPFKNQTFINAIVVSAMIFFSQIINLYGFFTLKNTNNAKQ